MESIDLKFISAYWCKSVSLRYVESFTWAWEKAEETVMEIGEDARSLLVSLAKSAPDEQAASYFAAGPLENYANLVVGEGNADEAAFIAGNRYLWRLLPLVWGKAEEIGPLAKLSRQPVHFQEPYPEKELKAAGITELMGFWCRVCGSSSSTEYEGPYNQMLKKLLNGKNREDAVHDITISAPEEALLEYVKDNIFVLKV